MRLRPPPQILLPVVKASNADLRAHRPVSHVFACLIDNYYIAITNIPGQKKPPYSPYDQNNDGRLDSLSTESYTEY